MNWLEIVKGFKENISNEHTQNTVNSYMSVVNRLGAFLGQKDDEEFKAPKNTDIEDFCENTDYSQTYIKKYALDCFFLYLKENGICDLVNPISIKEIYDDTVNRVILSQLEVYDLVKELDDETACFVLLAYEFMLKPSEIANLKFSDVDLINKKILNKTVSNELLHSMFNYRRNLYEMIDVSNKSRRKRKRPERELGEYMFQNKKMSKVSGNYIINIFRVNVEKFYEGLTIEDIRNSRKAKLVSELSIADVAEKYGVNKANLYTIKAFCETHNIKV